MVTSPTRGNNLLDLVLTGDPSTFHSCTVSTPFHSSDHNSVNMLVQCPVPRINASPRQVFLYSKGDYQGLNNVFKNNDWEGLFKNKSLDAMWDTLQDIYKKQVEIFIPSKIVKGGQRNGPPWTRYKSVLSAKKNKRKAFVQARKSGLSSDKILYDDSVKATKLSYTHAKAHYEQKLVEDIPSNPKYFWKLRQALYKILFHSGCS